MRHKYKKKERKEPELLISKLLFKTLLRGHAGGARTEISHGLSANHLISSQNHTSEVIMIKTIQTTKTPFTPKPFHASCMWIVFWSDLNPHIHSQGVLMATLHVSIQFSWFLSNIKNCWVFMTGLNPTLLHVLIIRGGFSCTILLKKTDALAQSFPLWLAEMVCVNTKVMTWPNVNWGHVHISLVHTWHWHLSWWPGYKWKVFKFRCKSIPETHWDTFDRSGHIRSVYINVSWVTLKKRPFNRWSLHCWSRRTCLFTCQGHLLKWDSARQQQ